MKSIWFTYRVKVAADKGASVVSDALLKLHADEKIEEYEFVRATPAKEEK
jgi:hypothetical protein